MDKAAPNNVNCNPIISTNEHYIRKLIEFARKGNIVRLIGIGNSMRPFLEGGRDYIDFIAVNDDTKLSKNDVVFYKSFNNQYVAHRIYSVAEKNFYLSGDGNLSIEPLIGRDKIFLKAVAFVRKGKYTSITSKKYLIYSNLWIKLYPLRIHLLRLYSRICKINSIIKKERKMKLKEDLMLRNIYDDWIVIPMGERLTEFNGMMKINQSGSFIWKLLETNKSRDEIVAALLENYEIDKDTATQELDIFINTLKEANLLEV